MVFDYYVVNKFPERSGRESADPSSQTHSFKEKSDRRV